MRASSSGSSEIALLALGVLARRRGTAVSRTRSGHHSAILSMPPLLCHTTTNTRANDTRNEVYKENLLYTIVSGVVVFSGSCVRLLGARRRGGGVCNTPSPSDPTKRQDKRAKTVNFYEGAGDGVDPFSPLPRISVFPVGSQQSGLRGLSGMRGPRFAPNNSRTVQHTTAARARSCWRALSSSV